MPLNNNGHNASGAGLAAVVGFISLHSADPGSTGTSELAGGSPAYARKAVTWGAPSGGVVGINMDPEFDIPAGGTVSHFGLWSASTGGTFYGGDPVSATENYGGQGVYILAASDVTYTAED